MFSFPAPDNTVVISKQPQLIFQSATEIIHSNYRCQRLLSAQKPPAFERFSLNV
jgi:hypothetical protein